MLVTVSSPSPAALAQATRAKVASDYCRYIEAHGFRAEDHSTINGLCVVAFIPYTLFGGKWPVHGIEEFPCKTFSEVRAALGY